MVDLLEDPDACPECGERHEGECEPSYAWFLKLSLEDQEEYMQECLKP